MKSNSILGYTHLLALLWILGACTDEIPLNGNDKPVVEAFLVPNQPFVVKITTQKPYTVATTGDSTTATPIKNLNVNIIGGSNNKTIELKYQKEGIYASSTEEKVGDANSIYTLSFVYKGRTINAQTIIPEKPAGFNMDKVETALAQIDLTSNNNGGVIGIGSNSGAGAAGSELAQLKWTNLNNQYHFFLVKNITPDPEYITKLPVGTVILDDLTGSYKTPPQKGNKASLYASDFKTFGKHAVVLFSVGSEYANLYNYSNVSSQNISTPPTNINNGLGIFTGINSDTLYFNVKKK